MPTIITQGAASARGFGLFTSQAWSPAAFGASLIGWWDAYLFSTFSLSGSNVSSWTSRAGTLVASRTASSAVTYSATARNSKPGVVFNGTAGLPMTAGTGTLPVGANACSMAARAYSPSSAKTFPVSYGTLAGSQMRGLGQEPFASIGMEFIGYGNDVPTVPATAWNATDLDCVVNVTNGTTASITAKVSGTTNSGSSSALTLNTVLTGAYLGADPGGTSIMPNGAVLQEVIILDRVMTGPEVTQLFAYLDARW